MDDQIFEQKLSNLKQSYQQLPLQTSSDKIMERIKKEEKKKRSFFSAQTLYAASFIGVLIIAGLLGAQLLMQKERGNGGTGDQPPAAVVPPSAEEIEARHKEVRQLYEDQLIAFDEAVSIADAEQYAFIQDAKKAVADFEKRETYKSKQELENYYNTVKQTVEQNVSVPSEQLANLRAKAEEGKQIKDEEIISLLEKQRVMNEYYFEKWLSISLNLQYTDVFAFADELNRTGTDDPEAGPIVKEIRDSGYRFYHEGEGMINFQPDLALLETALKPSPQMKKYFEVENQAQVTEDGAVSVSPQELADRTLALEDFINKNPNFKYGEKLKERYEFWLFLLLKGLTNSPAIDQENRLKEEWKSALEYVMEKDSNSQTAAVVTRFYNELKEKNFAFDSREQYEQYQVDVPESLAPAVSYKRGREFNILPLSDKIHKTYLVYKENGDVQALRDLQPSDIIRLYMYAVVKGDADTAYDLLYKGERTPAKEEFEMEIKNKSAGFQEISNRVYKVYEEYNEKGDTATFELIFKDGSSIKYEVKINLADYTSSVVYQ
jgi:organic radical activating enzyme